MLCQLPVIRISLKDRAAGIHLSHIFLVNPSDNERLMLTVARDRTDGRDFHTGCAVSRDAVHAGNRRKLFPQSLPQGIFFLHLIKFPARIVLILQKVLAPVSKLGLGHFFYIHRICIGRNTKQQNSGQA